MADESLPVRRKMSKKEKRKRQAEACARWRAAHPDRVLARTERGRERERIQKRAAYAADPERYREKRKKYRQANKGSVAAYMKGYHEKNKDRITLRDIGRRYGLNPAQYQDLLEQQDSRCAICRREETALDHRTGKPRRLSIDHDHATGEVRGLLCRTCNSALSYFGEDADRLRAAVAYLEKSKQSSDTLQAPHATGPGRT